MKQASIKFRRKALLPSALIIVLLAATCTDPFDLPTSQEYQSILVVEALFTDSPGPHVVRLSRSAPVGTTGNSLPFPENNATVRIEGSNGENITLSPQGQGEYLTAPSVRGTPGTAYRLLISFTDGRQYVSSFETMKPAPPISGLSYSRESRDTGSDEAEQEGVRILLDTRDPTNQTKFYRWVWEEDWEIRALLPVVTSWDFSANRQVPLPPGEERVRCWASARSTGISLGRTDFQARDELEKQPLFYIPSRGTDRLRVRYSVLVKQYALTENAFGFWQDLQKFNENTGSLFDPLPNEVRGNIVNEADPNEPVIGLFEVAGSSSRRLYIDNSEFEPPLFVPSIPTFFNCPIDTLTTAAELREALDNGRAFVYYEILLNEFYIADPPCADCRFRGENTPPDFWEGR